ncbi:peptidylprolyl isomerase SurA [Pseudoalteromonas sp. NBT06-2]|uniref:peptidylprolyl isomerase SurA n=1 Tax=Pseudoalteromonas sp. NBT06-2 TaxID=2025950 RepID=UPI000BA5FA3A|nr:peptidylprolyl isomerase SurA [Pseudoalteromonas sp. NBT06-2]PAJ74878.1 peptidylprolyl isomerase SurA [Pseudoalteromonas sp. NBT06-2]
MKLKTLLVSTVFGIGLNLGLNSNLIAKEVELDKVIAIVNSGVILESEVNTIINRVKNRAKTESQTLPSDKALYNQAIDRLINQSLLMQMADRMGLKISDGQLDQTLMRMAKEQNGTISDLRKTIEDSGDNYQAYREEIRTEMTTQQVLRGNVDRRIYVGLQEIDNLLKIMDKQQGSSEEYNLGHILIDIPTDATAQDIENSKKRAEKVISMLNKGDEFKRIAIASSGGSRALEGGQMGWMNINEMPTLFAEAVKGKKTNQIIGPLRSGAGFHIVKIQEIRGLQVVEALEVRSRHILIKPSIIVSEEKARSMLAGFVKDLKAGTADFAELAKEHSEDGGSALKGGEYDWTDPTTYVPAFRDNLLALKKDELSDPFRSQFGWHIVQLLEKRVADKTELAKRNRAHKMLYNKKYKEESFAWQREIREQAYVELIVEAN